MKKEEFKELGDKLPVLRNRTTIVLTILYLIGWIAVVVFFFRIINNLGWWGPLVSQASMSIIVCLIAWRHFKVTDQYRKKYGELAYQKYFYRYMIPYLVTWYGLFFHPAFLWGLRYFPWWIQIIFALLCFIAMEMTNTQIEKVGFILATHGMDLYSIFPENTKVVRGEIYGVIRHPLYFALFIGGMGMAFISGTWIAFLVALLQIVPCIFIGMWEDRELIARVGEDHRSYIKVTNLLFPIKQFPRFVKVLFMRKE